MGENSWKCCGFELFSYWQLWFHEKNWVKNSRKCCGFVFGQKFDFSNSVKNPVKKFSSKFVYIQAKPCRTQFNLTNFFTLKISILTRILLCLHFFHFNEYFQSKLKQPKHKILWSTILPLLKNLWPLLTLWKTSRTTKRTRKLFLRLCLIRTSKPR